MNSNPSDNVPNFQIDSDYRIQLLGDSVSEVPELCSSNLEALGLIQFDQPPTNPQTNSADQLSYTTNDHQHVDQTLDRLVTPVMSSPQGSRQTTPSSGDDRHSGTGKTRLTEDQKKKNHIKSETKRRKTIRGESIRITKIVPGAAADYRSEQKVIAHVAEYTAQLLKERAELVQKLEARGYAVEERLKHPRVNS